GRGSIAPVHVERHRSMLVHDEPSGIGPAASDRRAHPDVGFPAVGPLAADPVETPAERDVTAGCDAEVVNVVANWPLECPEPFSETPSERLPSQGLQWRREIEADDVSRVV